MYFKYMMLHYTIGTLQKVWLYYKKVVRYSTYGVNPGRNPQSRSIGRRDFRNRGSECYLLLILPKYDMWMMILEVDPYYHSAPQTKLCKLPHYFSLVRCHHIPSYAPHPHPKKKTISSPIWSHVIPNPMGFEFGEIQTLLGQIIAWSSPD